MRLKTMAGIGILVRDQRRQRGWSQTELAEKVGVSRLWVGHLEKGKESVEAGLVLRTLQALDLSLGVTPQQSMDFDFGGRS